MPADSPKSIAFNREKLLNAIIYFVRNTNHCHTLKLFKLLYFLDFEHFRQTGLSVTGLNYVAWPNGPAPVALWHELRAPTVELKRYVSVTPIKDEFTDTTLRRDIKAIKEFDPSHFTRREAKIMERLAFIFLDAKGNDMTEISHAKRMPWGKVYQNGEGKSRPISYELALTSEAILKDEPALTEAEYRYRKEAFAGIE